MGSFNLFCIALGFFAVLNFTGFSLTKNLSFILFFGFAIITAVIGWLIISLGVIVDHPSLFTEYLFATLFSTTTTAIFHKAFEDMVMRILMGGKWVVVRVKRSFEMTYSK